MTGARGAGLSAWCLPVSCRTPCRTRTGRMLRLTLVQRGWDETAPSVVRLVKGSRMEGMIVHVVGQDLVCQRRDLRWNLSKRRVWLWNRPTGQVRSRAGAAILILSRNTMVAEPDGELRRRLIGVEHLRQGWGRKRAGIARTGRPATGQPTRGPRTPAHASVPSGTWRPGPDERRSVCKTGGCGSSPSSTPSAAADGGR